MIKLYTYSKCSTCKKAQRFLDKELGTYTTIDITEEPPSLKELQAMLARVGVIKKLFNTSGQVYREMKLGPKLASLSEVEALKLLAGNGRLIKRPFLMKDGEAVAIGFNESAWKAIF